MEGNQQFLINLIIAFGGLSAIIVGFLSFFKDRLKIKIDDDTVKRKEVSELLEKLYNDTQTDLKLQRREHDDQIQKIKSDHQVELDKYRSQYAEDVRKRDIIIQEIILRIPKESRVVIQNKIKEMGLGEIIKE